MKITAKFLSLIIVFCMLIACVPSKIEANADDNAIFILAGSDFQAGSNEASSSNVKSIISAVKASGVTSIDGFLFGGDYNTEYDDKAEEIEALKSTVMGEFTTLNSKNMIFVQGNHDPAGSVGLSQSGANDSDHYGVFVINEDDYMWYNNDEARIKKTAENLETYLKAKSQNAYNKPIFVVSHLSLNYSKRTYNDGDGMYARYLFDVLNSYGKQLNIIFLFGHDHNNKYDDYIGGSTVYLTKGDEIFISKLGQKTATPDKFTLNFTYMNYGYVSAAYCLNNQISMTLFEIKDGIVKVKRVSPTGEIPLKTKGQWASSLDETASLYGTTDKYLETAYDGADYIGDEAKNGDVTVISDGIESITTEKLTNKRFSGFQTAYADYTITSKGYKSGATAVVKIKLSAKFDEEMPVFVRDTASDEIFITEMQNGRICFKTERLSSYEVYQTAETALSARKTTIYQPTTQFVDGKRMIIVSSNGVGSSYALQNSAGTSISAKEIEIKSGYGSVYIDDNDASILWKFIHDVDFGYASAIGDLENQKTGRYLVAENGGTNLSTVDGTEYEYTAWRNAASTEFGMYTLPNKNTYDRSYVKFDNEFIVSLTEDGARRVYLFVENELSVDVSGYADNLLGSVSASASGDATTGSKIYAVSTDGSIEEIEVSVSMLRDASGNRPDTSKAGVIENLALYYDGKLIASGYTLFVGTEVVYPDPIPSNVGDVNNDQLVNQYDYILVKRHYFGTRTLSDAELDAADVNRDQKVDQYDYILICRHYFGTYKIA